MSSGKARKNLSKILISHVTNEHVERHPAGAIDIRRLLEKFSASTIIEPK
jgi:hypothetical protein